MALIKQWFEGTGIRTEPTAPYTSAQNGPAERSGGVIHEKARAMRAAANLPEYLWPEIIRTAVYVHNRTPKWIYNWQTPYERLHLYIAIQQGVVVAGRKPRQEHLRAYGCKVYALTKAAKVGSEKKHKLNPRAWIGYLVGYSSTNIFRVWNPSKNTVYNTRDVIFDEKSFFTGNINDLKDDLAKMTSADLEEALRSAAAFEQNQPTQISTLDTALAALALNDGDSAGENDAGTTGASDAFSSEAAENSASQHPEGLVAADPVESRIDHPKLAQLAPYPTPQSSPSPPAAALFAESWTDITKEEIPEFPDLLNAAFSVSRGDEMRECAHRVWAATFLAARQASPKKLSGGIVVSRGKWAAGRAYLDNMIAPVNPPLAINNESKFVPGVIHVAGVPAAPKNRKAMLKHPLKEAFIEAEQDHLASHTKMQSWQEVSVKETRYRQLLGSMWVYTYKPDPKGYIQKCKARLVIRGDQQSRYDLEDTYANTLAARSFRALMAITARFDLDLYQYDAVNAFVNAVLKESVHMRLPEGYGKTGIILRVDKALYGLRQSPLRWLEELTGTLQELGFEQVKSEPCCYTRNGIILFFYVDDIVIAAPKGRATEVKEIAREVQQRYQLTGGSELRWFLGIEVIRDREKGRIWLSQASYAQNAPNTTNYLTEKPLSHVTRTR